MIRHRAPAELLLDYAAGALPEGPALALAVHAALDPANRKAVDQILAVGGALLEKEPQATLDAVMLDRTLSRLDQIEVESPSKPPKQAGFEWAPAPLLPYLEPGMSWRRAVGGFEEIRLNVFDGFHRVQLLRIEPGRGLPEHTHTGREYSVVLQGGYTDNTGSYGIGDFAIGSPVTVHQPIADPGGACIALLAIESPIKLTGRWARWLNPLVKHGLL